MAECKRCREAARIAREAVLIAEDLGTLYGIATGTGAVGLTTNATSGDGRIFKSRTSRAVKKKATRTVTKYQREFGIQLKKLKRAHPRTDISRLMKRAHTKTKAAMR
jgi:hypothetical protein